MPYKYSQLLTYLKSWRCSENCARGAWCKNSPSSEDELHHIKQWATANNLHLNQSKSAEIIFLPRGTRSTQVKPPSLITGIKRVNNIKALGVTLSSELSMSAHVCSILESCSRAVYGLRTLRAHGMQKECLHEVFRSTILARLTYASPAWSGFCSADDIKKLESTALSTKARKATTAIRNLHRSSNCLLMPQAEADALIFKSVLTNRNHFTLSASTCCWNSTLRSSYTSAQLDTYTQKLSLWQL